MIALSIPQRVGAVALATCGGTRVIGFGLLWYTGYFWACAVVIILRSFAALCLKGWKS